MDTSGCFDDGSHLWRKRMADVRSGAVTLKGNAVDLAGPELKAGDAAPDFKLQDNGLGDVALADSAGKKRIIITVPSLDTPTCHQETKRFNDEAGNRVYLHALRRLHKLKGNTVRPPEITAVPAFESTRNNRNRRTIKFNPFGSEVLVRFLDIIHYQRQVCHTEVACREVNLLALRRGELEELNVAAAGSGDV